jgi:cell division protein FtsB
MDMLQHIFEYVVGSLFAVGAWLWKSLVYRVRDLEEKHHDLEVKLNDKFIEKLDEVRKEIKQDIQKIADKLDSKQDKKRS